MSSYPKSKRKHAKGVSDSTLHRLWRKKVKSKYNGCVICGQQNLDECECHHIVHRVVKITRWDHRNGVPVCAPLTGRECHKKADMLEGRDKIRKLLGPDYSAIKQLEIQYARHRDYLIEHSLSENEWRKQIKESLK